MADYSKLFGQIKDNGIFILISIAMMVLVYAIAFAAERWIEKKHHMQFSNEKTRVNKMVVIAMFSAMATVLMMFEIPLPFAPSFYKLDFSEIPVLIGGFMFGPTAGVVIEGIKILLKIVMKGTTTAFVGDFANFVIGCGLVVPATIIYFIKKNRKSAIWGMIVGGLFMTVVGSMLNGYYLLPKFSELYGLPMNQLIQMGTVINPMIQSVGTMVAFAVVPFNLLKAVVVSVITGALYKYVSRMIKGQHVEKF